MHRLQPVSDDLLPLFVDLPPSTLQIATRATIVVGGLVLAGGAAYGIVPGELGHTGARVVDVREPHVKSAAEVLADAYRPAQRGVTGGASAAQLDGEDSNVVYVDGGTPSDGPSIVSTAFPAPNVSVLATRGDDGSCTWLRGTPSGAKFATAPATTGVACKADAAPRHGWTFSGAYGSKRN